jgi:uncharacterized membrane-anchored protein YjiN (DUF445 family)
LKGLLMDADANALTGIKVADKQVALAARKRLATSILSGVAACWVGSYLLPAGTEWASLLRSIAEASVVGGLADWFAVTAIFRRPLGLPIPHTALIPDSQPRIATGLATYIEREFLEAGMLAERLNKADVSNWVEHFLSDASNRAKAVDAIVGELPRLLARHRDMSVIPALATALRHAISGADLRPLALRTIKEAIRSPATGKLVGEIAELGRALVQKHRPDVTLAIGRGLGWWSPGAVDRKLAEGVCNAADEYLAALMVEASNERLRFDQWIKTLPAEMENNPEKLERAIIAAKTTLNDPQINMLVGLIWNEARDAALTDLTSKDSKIRAGLDALLVQVAQELDSNAMRRELNARLERLLVTNVPVWRTEITSFIKSSLGRYDPVSFARKLELEVGADLQIIRISGTIIGCFLGGMIFVMNHAAEWITSYFHSP